MNTFPRRNREKLPGAVAYEDAMRQVPEHALMNAGDKLPVGAGLN